MDHGYRWTGLVMVLATIVVGFLAYNAGVSHGLAVTATGAGVPAVAAYWPRWGFGFFPFGILIWLLAFRLLFWGGCGRRWYYRHGPYGPYGPGSFDDWHRQAHERMNNPPKA